MQMVTKAGLTVYIRLITVRLSFLLRTENYKHDGFFLRLSAFQTINKIKGICM